MKKLILSAVIMASMVMAANAVAYMRVKTTDGSVDEYHVENVEEVCYEETTGDQEVTVSGSVGNYTYVDLGLPSGTKWATYNVGATKPTEIGDYFAWGETKPKEDYSFNTYKWCIAREGLPDKFTKYCTDSVRGIVDNLMVLEPEDDAVIANWGSAWRMPTKEEIEELFEGCYWEFVADFDDSGVEGWIGTSTTNGNKILMPDAGRHEDAAFWSSSLRKGNSNYYAHCLVFSHVSGLGLFGSVRTSGLSVRAVVK